MNDNQNRIDVKLGYVIQNKNNGKWVSFSHKVGYVKTFYEAKKFTTKELTLDFCLRNQLEVEDHELFKLNVFAGFEKWV